MRDHLHAHISGREIGHLNVELSRIDAENRRQVGSKDRASTRQIRGNFSIHQVLLADLVRGTRRRESYAENGRDSIGRHGCDRRRA